MVVALLMQLVMLHRGNYHKVLQFCLTTTESIIVESVNKYTKRRLNSLPKLNKSGKSINIREYLNNLRDEIKKDENK